MLTKNNPLLKYAIGVALSGALAAPSAYADCYPPNGGGNWNAITWNGTGCTGVPQAGDYVKIDYTVSLNGVSTDIGHLAPTGNSILNDAGVGPGSLKTVLVTLRNATLDFTQNNSTFTSTGSGISLGGWWAGRRI